MAEGKKQRTIAQDNFKIKGRSNQVKQSGFSEAKCPLKIIAQYSIEIVVS